jgi:beta-glucanase (GH16 family)
MVRLSVLTGILLALGAAAQTPVNPRRPTNCRRGAGCTTTTTTTTTTPTPTPTPIVQFNEEFTGTSLASTWFRASGHKYDDPRAPNNWGTGEIQSYAGTSDVLSVSNGLLTIRPIRVNNEWKSARIETTQTFTPQINKTFRAEARLKLGSAAASRQAGIWPAFWMLGADYRSNFDWPNVGEVDVMENLNGENRAFHVVHCATCNEPNGRGSTTTITHGQFHVLRFEIKRAASTNSWQTETLSWYLNGALTFQLQGSDIGNFNSWSALAYSSRFLLLNVAVGGGFPDALWGSTTPTSGTITSGSGTEMQVDYVKVGHVEDRVLW